MCSRMRHACVVLRAHPLTSRFAQFFWALLVMAIVGNMIAESDGGNPSIINYAIFVALFGMLSLFFLIPATVKPSLAFMPILPFVIDLLNVLFWFCGAVALAAQLGAHSCSNQVRAKNIPRAGTIVIWILMGS